MNVGTGKAPVSDQCDSAKLRICKTYENYTHSRKDSTSVLSDRVLKRAFEWMFKFLWN
jgi:hypothetical protein